MLALLPFLTLALALPTPREVGIETCTSVASGTLTDASGNGLLFHIDSSSGLLSYGPDENGDGLEVSFDRCDPNFENWPQNSTLLTGHLSLSSTSPLQCLTVASPGTPTPHELSLSPCSVSEDSSQILQQFLQLTSEDDGSVTYVWAGFTDNRGDVQDANTCEGGQLGFMGGREEGVVLVECVGDEEVEVWAI